MSDSDPIELIKNTRNNLQSLRGTAEQVEATITNLQMLMSALRDRKESIERGTDPIRSDDSILEHPQRIIEQHESGARQLNFLQERLNDLEVGSNVTHSDETVLPLRDAFSRLLDPANSDPIDNEIRAIVRSALEANDIQRLDEITWFVEWLVTEARNELAAIRAKVTDEQEAHVQALDTAILSGIDPIEELGWSDPVAFLPVRLETSFDMGRNVLRVRVYPDQIHLDTHEPQLSESELEWGKTFWARIWFVSFAVPSGTSTAEEVYVSVRQRWEVDALPTGRLKPALNELFEQYEEGYSEDPTERFAEVKRRAWAEGVDRFGEERAAYIVHILSPIRALPREKESIGDDLLAGWVDGISPWETETLDSAGLPLRFPDIDVRPESWTRTPRAGCLPDRWVIYAYYGEEDDEQETDWVKVGPSDSGTWARRIGKRWVRRVYGPPIADPLPVGPSPENVARDGEDSGSLNWMINFEVAKSVGMGIEVPLPRDVAWQGAPRFSRLVVVGIRTSETATESASSLGRLLNATRYTDGLEILEPGTATNNADEPSGRTSRRRSTANADVVAAPVTLGDESNGARLQSIFGINSDTNLAPFGRVAGTDGTREVDARAVNAALWPATLGYYARHLFVDNGSEYARGDGPMSQEIPELLGWYETYRRHFIDYVRSGGPVPAFRAGKQPYGILPTTPLKVEEDETALRVVDTSDSINGDEPPDENKFRPPTVELIENDQFLAELINHVWSLSSAWDQSVNNVPSIGVNSGLSDSELMRLLTMEAIACGYQYQELSLDRGNPLNPRLEGTTDGEMINERFDDAKESTQQALSFLNLDPFDSFEPRIGDLLFLGGALIASEPPITDTHISTFIESVLQLYSDLDKGTLSVRALGTDPDVEEIYFSLYAQNPRESFFGMRDDPQYSANTSLLRSLLRFAALQAAIDSRIRLGQIYDDPANYPPEPLEFERDDLDSFSRLYHPLKDQDARHPHSGDSLVGYGPFAPANDDGKSSSTYEEVVKWTFSSSSNGDFDPVLGEFAAALRHLRTLEPDRLERLTSETLDLASHRLDAWCTSIASRQLSTIREGQTDRNEDGGIHIGGFGFVENLEPVSESDAEYLLAPSLDQATTASVLRSAHRSHANDDPASVPPHRRTLAVDLSANRVQRARELLGGVRRGQSLSRLLGYRFEREFRDAGDNIEQYIDDFRAIAPSSETRAKRGDEEGTLGQSDVVNGLTLLRLWQNNRLWAELTNQVNGEGAEAANRAANEVLERIDDTMDAVSDLLTAEGVHHLIHGRPERAAAALEALSRGATPPEVEVLNTPRTETGVTHRLLLLFADAKAQPRLGGWSLPYQRLVQPADLPGVEGDPEPVSDTIAVRHTAEPNLTTWASHQLPAPSRIGCVGEFQWEAERDFAVGTFRTPATPSVVQIDVGFEPDLVLFSATGATEIDGTPTHGAATTGWTHGVYRRAANDDSQSQHSLSVATGGSGFASHIGSDSQAIVIAAPPGAETPPGGDPVRLAAGHVVRTTSEGFEMQFTSVAASSEEGRPIVSYQAFSLADPTSVRVGTFQTSDVPGEQVVPLSETGSDGEFSPDHVLLFATNAVDGITTAETSDTPVGFTHGDVVETASGFDQRAIGYTFDSTESDGHHRVTATDEAALFLATAGNENVNVLTASVTSISDDELIFEYREPDGAEESIAPRTTAIYVAFESPVTQTETDSITHRPATGYAEPIVDPGADAEAVAKIDVGFRPGLIEVHASSAITTDAFAGSSPRSMLIPPPEDATGWSRGIATGHVIQSALASGSETAVGSRTSVLNFLSSDSTGTLEEIVTEGRITEVSETGFSISLDGIDGSPPIVFYRAWPAEPATQAFAAPCELTLDSLNLTPLDAIALTQSAGDAGDSQIERRIGYHLFRHLPAHRPPVPAEATLDLSFRQTPDSPAVDVSIAEYIEMARATRAVVGDGRAADARDVAHPGEAVDEGHGEVSSGSAAGTIDVLEERADELEGVMSDVHTIIANRVDRIGQQTVFDDVRNLSNAVRRLDETTPLTSTIDISTQLVESYPATPRTVEEGLLGELRIVADHLRAGSIVSDERSAMIVVTSGSEEEVSGNVNVESETQLDVSLWSYTDAVRFDPQTRQVSTDRDGKFAVTFDFDRAVPGTKFLVVGIRKDVDPTEHDNLSRLIGQTVRRLQPERQREILVELLEYDGTLDDDETETIESNIRRFDRLEPEERVNLFVDLNRSAKLVILNLVGSELGRSDLLERYWQSVSLYEAVMSVAASLSYNLQVDVMEQILDSAQLDIDPLEREALERRLSRFEEFSLDERAETFLLVGKEGYMILLAEADEEGLLNRFEEVAVPVGQQPVFLAEGCVAPDSETESTAPLPEAIAEQKYLSLLLWMSSIQPEYDPFSDEDTASAELHRELGNAQWTAIEDERDLMRIVRSTLTAGTAQTFTDDISAVQRLTALQALDLGAVSNDLASIIAPLRTSGLLELVSTVGGRTDPGALHVYRSNAPEIDALVQKDPEGEVRSRLERLLERPAIIDDHDTDISGYSLALRRAIENGLSRDAILTIERFLSDPTAAIDVLSGHLSTPHRFIVDLHDLFHHDRYAGSRDEQLGSVSTRLEAFLTVSPTDGSLRGKLVRLDTVEDVDRLEYAFSQLLRVLPAVRSSLLGEPSDPELAIAEYQSAYRESVDRTHETISTHISDRLLPATEAGGFLFSFRRGVLESLRQGLLRASYFGIYGSTPASAAGGTGEDADVLVSQAERVNTELERRLRESQSSASNRTVEAQIARIQSLLGEEFTILPPFKVHNANELNTAFERSDLSDGEMFFLNDDPYATDTWLQRTARIRERPAAFQTARTYGSALALNETTSAPFGRTLSVAQFPYDPECQWIGLDEVLPKGGELSLVASFVDQTTVFDSRDGSTGRSSIPFGVNGSSAAGLLVDEWVERTPAASESIGVGIRFDDPSSRPPQSVLLAVPPQWSRRPTGDDTTAEWEYHQSARQDEMVIPEWTDSALLSTIEETVQWIRLRTVSPDSLKGFGHLLPALYFPRNETYTALFEVDFVPDTPVAGLNKIDWIFRSNKR